MPTDKRDRKPSALGAAVTAARSKLHHQERMRAAEQQRDAGYVELHKLGWSYARIEQEMRAGLGAAGFTFAQIRSCGVSRHNIRRAIRDAR